MLPLLLTACTQDLLPGEVVLPGDVPVEVRYGPPSSALGQTVAWREGVLLATAPGTGTVVVGEGGVAVDAVWAGFWGADVVFADVDGEVYVNGEPRWSVPDAVAFASGDTGVVASDGERLHLLDRGRSVRVEGLQAVAVGAERVLGVVCADTCTAQAWDFFGNPLGEWAAAGDGGAVAEWDGVAWAGAPDDETPDGRGRVRGEHGEEVVGEPGDHLGVAIGGGFVAGRFNKWIVPPRGRVVPLAGGEVYALERGGEDQPVALAGDGETLVVGSPSYPHGGTPTGAILTVGRP